MKIIAKCHQQTNTCDANRYLSARVEVVTQVVLLLLLLYFSVFSATAQRGQEHIVYVSDQADIQKIYVRKADDSLVKQLTLEGRYQAPSLSYDGKRVAFASADGRSRDYDIFVMDIQSREQRQVTFSGSRELYPSWAPDGSRIVFASDAGGVFNLYTVDVNGENRTRLTNSTGDDVQPDWSPDGRKIAFASDQASAVHQIYWVVVKTGHQKKLTQSDFNTRYPRWSPDGTKLAFYSAVVDRTPKPNDTMQIWKGSSDGRGLENLIKDGKYNIDPAYSPDGETMAFASSRNDNLDIYTLDTESMKVLRLTRDKSFDYQPSWSSDGKHLVFISERTGNPDIYRINAKGRGIVNLTKSETDEYMPAWSPKGDKICFVRIVHGTREIHVMGTNGNRQMRLDNSPAYNTSPTWSPRGEKIAFVNKPDRDSKVYHIYTIDPDGQNKRLLFRTLASEIRSISWSADGKKILFVHYNDEMQQIRILDVMTREVNPIKFAVFGITSAAWMPFGGTIVFSAYPVNLRSTLHYGIFLMDDNGKNQELLWDTFILDSQYRKQRFSWSPDGKNILFSRGDGNLYVTDLNGGGATRFLNNAHSPDWKTPRAWRSVTPKNKLQTTWGEVKK